MLSRLWSRVWFRYSQSLAVVTAAAVVVREAREAAWPDAGFWASVPWTGVVGLVAILTSLLIAGQVWWLSAHLKVDRKQRNVHRNARFLLSTVYDRVPDRRLYATKLAVHVWLVTRRGMPLRRQEVLKRVARFSFQGRNHSQVVWTRDKGVLGLAWRNDDAYTIDLRPLKAVADRSEAAFNARKEEFRLGLTWHEYRQTRDYCAVYARPLYDTSRRIIGLVSIDSSQQDAWEYLTKAVDDPDMVRTALTGVESSLRELLFAESIEEADE